MISGLYSDPAWLPVAAAAICRDDGRMLLYRRPEGKQHAGLWEFPGGKVEAGETPANALVREIAEELGLMLDNTSFAPVAFAESAGEEGRPAILLLLYKVTRWTGEPEALEGGGWGWFTVEEAAALPKPPLDVELLAVLREREKSAG